MAWNIEEFELVWPAACRVHSGEPVVALPNCLLA